MASHKLADINLLVKTGQVPQGTNFAVKAKTILAGMESGSAQVLQEGATGTKLSLEQAAARFSDSIYLIIAE